MITYIYPKGINSSFTFVARTYIKMLRILGFDVKEVSESRLRKTNSIIEDEIVIVHPLFYNEKYVNKIKADKIIGVDVVETTNIPYKYLRLVNSIDYLLVPSRYCVYVAKYLLGLDNVLLLPHFLPMEYNRPVRDPKNSIIKWLRLVKQKEKWIGILYFLNHSGSRKNAGKVYEAIMDLKDNHNMNIKLIIKRGYAKDHFLGLLWTTDAIDIAGFIEIDDLIDLYDSVDVHISISRAGGFELHALESIARGVITVAPVCGCYMEYEDLITTPIGCKHEYCFYKSDIHVGLGWDIDLLDLKFKLIDIVNNIKFYREIARKRAKECLDRYGFEAGIKYLKNIVDKIFYR